MRAALAALGALAPGLLLLAACRSDGGAFRCFADDECALAASAGICQPTGWCSFSDPDCDTGQRYGTWVGDGLADLCVPAGGDGPEPQLPDAGPAPACGLLGDECCAAAPACTGGLECAASTCTCAGLGAPSSGVYSRHACLRHRDGRAFCWGDDGAGQIGNGGTGGSRKEPVAVSALTGVTLLALGSAHTCAVAAGDLYCWGDNAAGQLGRPGGDRDEPERIDLPGVIALEAGAATTCAVVTGGAVRCWGRNQLGQVGDGTDDDRNRPTAVVGLPLAATAVTSGTTLSCARLVDGSAWCWGAGDEGQLGDGTGESSATPRQVALDDVVEIDAGDDQACARRGDGTVWCWGDNEAGALGDGTTTERRSPVQVGGLAGAVELEVADEFACARTAAGAVRCWGQNDVGQLGAGRTSEREPAPVGVVGVDDAVGIAAGADHACALRASGVLVCWGAGADGQLGDGASSMVRPVAEPIRFACP